ncbi:cytochrome-c peroxidase [Tamlana crocina]|uniref:Cytochrome-c peroxidase n=1 Tax=Tamlana crocina TaxID=393006 RepID=A0ABX1DEN3_9FLAO|nr:cytochrome c peroxidase [Tamlana crocina]NJX16715.1 cytochrome-c peroxidase [Tamlana crocina]
MEKPLLTLVCLVLLWSCSSDNADEYVPAPVALSVEQPANFPEIKYNMEANPPTDAGFELGKKLFYEGNLSSSGVISCGFCHEQASAFTHHGHTISHGENGLEGFRNTQPIQNLAYFSEFTWDGAAIHLDLQPIIPITAEVEMNETIPSVLEKLQNLPEYPDMFNRAFGTPEINSERMLKALSQFMVMMVSSNSKYDKVVRGEDGVEFTELEAEGRAIFNEKCASCHATDLFSDQTYRNNGIPFNPKFKDEEQGRQRVFGYVSDFYKFRVPSLRNIEYSFPYMHDGRFGTLEAVLDFYAFGMAENGGEIDPILRKKDGRLGIDLSEHDKEAIIAFLKTLTDHEFLNDERFAEF